ncbi:MAG: acyltransferase family protein, partial [Oscillospiraceae bacterium]|nr:acyltransferase family protein [Oscillospiraceae bacterium]
MDLIRQKKREYEPGVDILRVLVLVMVFILHYYFENGFYFQPVSSPAMFFHSLLRTVTVCSVPLFLILTGYLRCAQQYRKGYYRSLLPLLCSYIFVSLLCGLFIMAFEERQLALSDWVKGITGFEFAEYGWYVNMYIGLFLLSPLVNKLWNALESRENHQKLIALVFAVAVLSSSVNGIYPLLPDFWNCLWPFAYYLSGCYIKSYRPKLAFLRGLGLILACAGAITALNIATGGVESFNKGYMPDYDEFPCVLLSLLIFCTFYHLDCKSEKAASLFRSLAPHVFTMILVSIIFNTLFFPQRYMLYGPEDYGFQGLWRVALSLFCSWCVAVPVDALSVRLCSIPRPSQWREDIREKLWKALVCAGFLGSFAFLVWKCRYGFGNMDEAFYLSIPIRLCQGEALIVDEWHVSQLSAFLLWPLMYLYRLVFGTSNDGIILNFRYIYVGVQFLCSLFLYKRWKALSKYGAFAAALLFLLFAPYGISALSYNSLGLICISLSVTFAATAEKNIPLQQLLAGLFLACAVLCCPAVAVLYPLYLVAVLAFSVKSLREKRPDIL